jgi:hypothetical protein
VAAFPIYFAINSAMLLGTTALFVALVANQTINFHHFIVDAVVWRQKRKPAGLPA